jgi:hypothetical protein
VDGNMHITGGKADFQSQHTFTHTEQNLALRQPVSALSAPPSSPARFGESQSGDESETALNKDTSLLKALVEAMIGKQIDTLDLNAATPAPDVNRAASAGTVLRAAISQTDETEITQVAVAGQFSTDDGGAISVDLQFVLARQYSSITAAASIDNNRTAKDPLILNFDGLGMALEQRQTNFDLNSDGQTERLATLAAGSAYLALDRNGNGRIDDGRELFGPVSNNGYAELAKYDSDGNGFIDGADPVFAKLQLFRPGESMETLADRDVGAIFLGHAASPARLTDNRNQSLGQLRATGFYLTNSGGAGLVQEFDLTV